MTHNQLQAYCWKHLWNTYPEARYCCWHTKNEDIPYKGETKDSYVKRRSQDKAIGLLPGVWDLVLYQKGILYIFDVKIGKDKLSEKQQRFEKAILEQGGVSLEIRNLDDFVEHCKIIFNGARKESKT